MGVIEGPGINITVNVVINGGILYDRTSNLVLFRTVAVCNHTTVCRSRDMMNDNFRRMDRTFLYPDPIPYTLSEISNKNSLSQFELRILQLEKIEKDSIVIEKSSKIRTSKESTSRVPTTLLATVPPSKHVTANNSNHSNTNNNTRHNHSNNNTQRNVKTNTPTRLERRRMSKEVIIHHKQRKSNNSSNSSNVNGKVVITAK